MKSKVKVGMLLNQFIAAHSGRMNVGDTPGNKGQCVGLIEVWVDTLKLPHIWGNAADLLSNADKAMFGRIDNTPTNYPLAGDIVVWGTSWGEGFGHTGVCVTGNVLIMSIFQQNDPQGSGAHLKAYTYAGVLGWLRPFVKS
jgi:hypothetical protein